MQQLNLPRQLKVDTEIENATAGLAEITYVDTEIENATTGLADDNIC